MARTQAFEVRVSTAEMSSFWQGAASAMDGTTLRYLDPNFSRLAVQSTTYKALVGAQVLPTNNLAAFIASVQSHVPAITETIFDQEGVTSAQFLTSVATAYSAISGAGLKMQATPTGSVFKAIQAAGQLATVVANCDSVMYQAEGDQESGTGWQTTVAAQVAAWRALTAKKVVLQLSVNPPANPTATAAQVIADVDLVLAALAAPPDYVKLFFTFSDSSRVAVAEAVYQHYMGGVYVSPAASRAKRSG